MQQWLSSWTKERLSSTRALLIILLYVSPLYVLGENAHILIHDNMDSNISWYKVLDRKVESYSVL